MNLKTFNFDKTWSLFLDRDGVINKKIEGDYVRTWSQFEFLPGVIDALKILMEVFGRIIIVTNQRGIGRGLMSEENLKLIHKNMCNVLNSEGIKIDGIYYCPHDYEKISCDCRKPNIGLALQAQKDFPSIDFKKSVIVGDSESDILFGVKLGMITVYINENNTEILKQAVDFKFCSLLDFAKAIFHQKLTNRRFLNKINT